MINLWPLFMKADTLSLKWVHSYSIKSQCLRANFFLSVSSASVDDAEADFTSSTHLNEMQEYTPDNGRSLALCCECPGRRRDGHVPFLTLLKQLKKKRNAEKNSQLMHRVLL